MLPAIVGILLGNFLIGTLFAPTLTRLRNIIDKFAGIELPFKSSLVRLGLAQADDATRRQAEEKAMSEFSLYYREYVIAFAHFKELASVFLGALLVLISVSLWQIGGSVLLRVVVITVCNLALIILGLRVQRIVAPNPAQLVSIDSLANRFANLHQEPLFDTADIHINFGTGLLAKDEQMHFSLVAKAFFLGYRLLFAVTDEDCTKLFFVAYGGVNSKTTVNHVWNPDHSGFFVQLGDFPFMQFVKTKQSLMLHFWLFVPSPKGWATESPDNPRYVHGEIYTPNWGWAFASGSAKWSDFDRGIEFECKSSMGIEDWKLLKIDAEQPNAPQGIVKMFRRDLEASTRVIAHVYPEGVTVNR